MKIRKGLVGKISAGMLVLVGLVNSANGDGNLRMYNRLDTRGSNNSISINHISFEGVSEGLDNFDGFIPSFMPNRSGVYTFVDGQYLNNDYRPTALNFPFPLNIYFNGTTDSELGNHLEILLDPNSTGNTFDGKPIRLQFADANWNRFGTQYDILSILDPVTRTGNLLLPNLAAGSYSYTEPYLRAILDFEPIQVEPFSHTLQITSYDATGKPSTNPLVLTYTNDGSGTNARNDATDVSLAKTYPELATDEAMVYSINEPFSTLERLVNDVRVDGNTLFEVGHGENYSASKLGFKVDPADIDYFNDFNLGIRSPVYNDSGNTQISLADILDSATGEGYVDFADPSFPFIFGNLECIFSRGPTSFELIATGNSSFMNPDDSLVIGEGTEVVAVPYSPGKLAKDYAPGVPEPGTLGLLASALLVAVAALAAANARGRGRAKSQAAKR